MAAAYGALVSVMQIIHQIEHHPFPPISIDKHQAESLTEVVSSLQEFLEGYHSPVADADEADPLEMRIADAAYAAEDVIESNIVDRILPHGAESQRNRLGFFNCFRSPKNDGETRKISTLDLYEGLQKVIEDLDLIKKEAMEIVAEKKDVIEVRDQLQRQVSASSTSSLTRLDNSSRPSLTRLSSSTDMVGRDDACLEIMDKLTGGRRGRQLIPIVGMGGIGKTTLARTVYSKPLVKEHFDFCAWATISQQHNKKQILCEILSQSKREGEQLSKMREEEAQRLSKMREDELELELHKYLSYRRFLIVLDDMWSIEAWEKIQHSFPNNNNSSRILVTTRLSNLGSQLDSSYCLKMKSLDLVSGWTMFSKIVFEGRDCPIALKKIGIEIVENCRGLPLTIVVMGGLLAKLQPTKKCWESIGKNLNSLVNSENNDHCLKILKTSYDHLPVHLKPCFLYMGVFEEDSKIRVSTLIELWVSEGFLKPTSGGESLETVAKEYLKDLVDRNLILVVVDELFTESFKYCKLHDLLRDLCLREAQKERFYHVLGQHSPHATCRQRRIVIPKSTSKKKVLEALESMPRIRSYISEDAVVRPLPNLRFLRILKAYERDVYSGYMHELRNMFELVNTRYIGVGAHRHLKIPTSINMMWNLQTLIVAHPRKVDAPVEIWKMAQLRHIHFCKQGLYLPSPPSNNTVIMENLQTLKGVRNFRFDEEIVRGIPNVVTLELKYDYKKGPEFNGDYYCLSNVKCLSKLESLCYKCSSQAYDNLHMITFPESLRKLFIRSLSFVWQGVLEKISSLPHLQRLTLIYGEFRGGEWETVDGGFRSLKSLYLRVYNWEKWTMESSSHFPCLERLYLVELEGLKEIPAEIGEIPTLQLIMLDECSESAVMSAREIVKEQEELQGEDLPFKVRVFIDKKNQAVQSLANPNFQVVCYNK